MNKQYLEQADLLVNPGKTETIEVDGINYRRLCIRTHLLLEGEDLVAAVQHYAEHHLEEGDILFVTEKAVAATQGRAIPLTDIKPSRLARFLARFVYKNPGGIGLAMPETMEMALRECGRLRILLAAFIAVIGKLLGRRGWFYHIAGSKARSIDGPTAYALPPFNSCVVMGPKDPNRVAKELSKALNCSVVITDINDLGGNILGKSDAKLADSLLTRILADNPLGQGSQQTPLGIIRAIS